MKNSRSTGLALVAAGIGAAMAFRASRRRGFSFRGQSVLITGGSRGLGLVMARQLAAEGARLTLAARNADELAKAAADLRARQPLVAVTTVVTDVTHEDDAERAIAHAVGAYGRIDVLVNNAGIIQVGPLAHVKLSDYDDAMKTHFWGPLFMINAALPYMREQGAGRIVNIASIGGKMAVPHLVPYSASKFALVGLSDGLRAELARENIVVTTVCPGLLRTGSAINASIKGQHADEYSWFAIASSLPVLTISAERAAGQIIRACRGGDAELIITPLAKLAVAMRALLPELASKTMSVANEILPRAGAPSGDVAHAGRDAGPGWAPPLLVAPMHAAARRNNEL